MSDNNEMSPYFFTVEIDGIETARFQKCEGLEAETSIIEIEEGRYGTHKFSGRTRYPNIILEKGINDNNELFDWYKQIALEDRKFERKNGSVILKDIQGNEIKRWNFYRALPCRWVGPNLEAVLNSGFAVERIEITHEGFEVDDDTIPKKMETNNISLNSNNVAMHQTASNESDYHCDIISWNEAIDAGLDPRDQNGQEWNGNELTVEQIYERYQNNRTPGTPPNNTAGYAFYDTPNDSDDIPEHMEFYDNRNNNGNGYTLYRTDGIQNPQQQQRTRNDPNRTFVPLNDLQ